MRNFSEKMKGCVISIQIACMYSSRFSILSTSLVLIVVTTSFFSCRTGDTPAFRSWRVYRGDDGVNAYSALKQIDTANVKKLQVAWTYRTGDNIGNSSIECNPIVIDGILYGVSPKMKAFALDATTGKELWKFDPFEPGSKQGGVSRGVCYWKEGDEERIFLCASYKLIAIDAKSGKQVKQFGDSGYADLRKGLRNDAELEKYTIYNTSPGVVYNDLVIVGSSMGESYLDLPGNIRAYDVRTGKLRWNFNTIPRPGEFGYDSWPDSAYTYAGGCNAWSGLSIDRERGMLFAATGAPAFDFHGGDRKGDNLFANSVIALDAATGKYRWHYQISHHDLWDYDLPTPPNLVTLNKDGRMIDAVVQLTKQGWIFMLDRETGKPLYPVEEKPVPPSPMEDEFASPTQPFPTFPAPLSRHGFDTSLITDISAESGTYIRNEVARYDLGGIYTPPGTKGIIQLPGFRGGAEWSGGAIDPFTGILYIGVNDIPNVVQLVELKNDDQSEMEKMPVVKAGSMIYQNYCSPCHGPDRRGAGPYPSLAHVGSRLAAPQIMEVVSRGRNKMPSFSHLTARQREAVIAFLLNRKQARWEDFAREKDTASHIVPSRKKYKIKAYMQLKDQFGYPGVKPPWGTLNALDLHTGKLLWRRTLGEYPELTQKGIPETGTQLFGGGVATAGGLIFMGASRDEKFRAIDKKTGKTLWEYQLPAGGYATPAVYEAGGRQFVVIAAGGGGFQTTKTGDYFIAFSLPEE